jgi:hypothetical protein
MLNKALGTTTCSSPTYFQHSTVRFKQLCQLRETREIYNLILLMIEFSWRPRRPIVMSRTTPQCKTLGRVGASDVILTRHWTASIDGWRRGFGPTLRGTGTRPHPPPPPEKPHWSEQHTDGATYWNIAWAQISCFINLTLINNYVYHYLFTAYLTMLSAARSM